ncbi:Crp/Fnr family transcriptional regulator [Bacillus sp. AFS076308]|uniref:Crp/Fnr family transcriptional regulator n=1 Tax=unclassified Bacillus (in: firmicutes) TaxID=185979 RepID=UPI000BF8CB7E|nr:MULTISPECIES: Crp/Fnr family transcriptional regulator [unclassified Bacillus (in: firmicutes)]PFO08385.1 Crp/Fnr family transcriptional regulator [Bacillus sp. AFS076308]PGV50606.1 Crp/Fnr family transcriptional regulator [Bacillus sp. AFS037270]
MDNTHQCHLNHECSKTGSHKTCVSLVPIFNHLEVEQMNEIMAVVQSVSIKKGELIYHEGDQSNSLYIVNKGKVRIYRLSETGKEQLVRILNPGDFTGELALFRNDMHKSFAEAMTDSQVCTIHQADLKNLLLKYPSISLKILEEFSNRLDQSEKQTTRFATEKVETRIARFLAECLEDSDSKEIFLPMSKKNLASYLGTTPETISRKLAELEEQGFIKQRGHKKIEIVDVDGLLLI